MELRNKDEIRNEILQGWLKDAWVYPVDGPDERVYLRPTPGGRLKMRKKIRFLENDLGESGTELAKQEEAGTLPVEREKLELAMMVQVYSSERKFIQSQGQNLGSAGVELEAEEPGEDSPERDSPVS